MEIVMDSEAGWGTIIVYVAVLIFCLYGMWMLATDKDKRLNKIKALPKMGNPTLFHSKTKDKTIIAAGEDGTFAISYFVNPTLYHFNGEQIESIKFMRDESTVIQTNGEHMITRAVVGGLLLGPIGAIVGGVTADKSAAEKVKKLSLHLKLTQSEGIHEIVFFENVYGAPPETPIVQEAVKQATWWLEELVESQSNAQTA